MYMSCGPCQVKSLGIRKIRPITQRSLTSLSNMVVNTTRKSSSAGVILVGLGITALMGFLLTRK